MFKPVEEAQAVTNQYAGRSFIGLRVPAAWLKKEESNEVCIPHVTGTTSYREPKYQRWKGGVPDGCRVQGEVHGIGTSSRNEKTKFKEKTVETSAAQAREELQKGL